MPNSRPEQVPELVSSATKVDKKSAKKTGKKKSKNFVDFYDVFTVEEAIKFCEKLDLQDLDLPRNEYRVTYNGRYQCLLCKHVARDLCKLKAHRLFHVRDRLKTCIVCIRQGKPNSKRCMITENAYNIHMRDFHGLKLTSLSKKKGSRERLLYDYLRKYVRVELFTNDEEFDEKVEKKRAKNKKFRLRGGFFVKKTLKIW